MAQITEHDTKEEGECDDREYCRIDFLVHWNTVGVHDLLEDPCELICLDVSRGLDTMVFIALEVCGGETSQGTSDCILLQRRAPKISDIGRFTLAHVVQSSIDSLLLNNEPSVDL